MRAAGMDFQQMKSVRAAIMLLSFFEGLLMKNSRGEARDMLLKSLRESE